jgi:hypothetical protein
MKKKSLLILIIAINTIVANAQIKKSSLLLGGQLSFSTGKQKLDNNDTWKASSIVVSPSFGQAVADNLIVGVDAAFGYSKGEQPPAPGGATIKSSSVGGGVFIRKYLTLTNGFYLFGHGRLGGSYFKQDISPYSAGTFYHYKSYQAGLSFSPGLSYAVNRKLHIETGFYNLLNIFYSHATTNTDGSGSVVENKRNTVQVNSSLSSGSTLTVGFRLLLSKA